MPIELGALAQEAKDSPIKAASSNIHFRAAGCGAPYNLSGQMTGKKPQGVYNIDGKGLVFDIERALLNHKKKKRQVT